MGRPLSQAEVALFFGYSLPTVRSWSEEEPPVPMKAAGGHGKAYTYDSEAVHRWLLARTPKRLGRKSTREREPEIDPDSGERRITLDEATRRKAVADALKAELAFATAKEAVAPIDMIAKVVSDEIANARARLLAIPTKIRPDAQVCCSTPEKAKRLVGKVEDLVREAMTEIKTYGGAE